MPVIWGYDRCLCIIGVLAMRRWLRTRHWHRRAMMAAVAQELDPSSLKPGIADKTACRSVAFEENSFVVCMLDLRRLDGSSVSSRNSVSIR
jgi:hypothetical protein